MGAYPTLGFDPCPGDPEGVTTLADGWQDAAFLLSEIAIRLDGTDPIQDRWRGEAADAFRTRLDAQRVVIGKFRACCESNMELLKRWRNELQEFQTEAAQLETRAADLVNAQKQRVESPTAALADPISGTPAGPDESDGLAKMRTHLSGIRSQAEDLHARYLDAARRLARQVSALLILPSGTTGWFGQDIDTAEETRLLLQESHRASGVVPVDPTLRMAWWNALTPTEQAAMAHDHATDIGSANGLPAEVRNAANMLLLKQYRDQAAATAERLDQTEPGSDTARAADDRYRALADLYSSLTNPDDPNYRQPSYLLGIDQKGPQGHAIVCYGNPDTALNTAVYVPGTGSNLNHIMRDASRAGKMYDAANASDPGSTASMVWLGYDAPQSVYTDSPFPSWADNGAPVLAAYVNSLALTHQGPSHVTVIGHSYGTTLVGDAAAHQGMHADDLVFVGSPGVTVDHAADLHMDPHHVWAGKMANDLVPPVSLPLPWQDPLKWGDDYSERFGADPTSSEFGGRTFASGYGELRPDRSHSDYWNDDEPSFANMTRIVTGHPGDVTAPSTAERDGTFPTGLGPGTIFQTVGGIEQELGHAIPGGHGAPLEHFGAATDQVGHGANAVAGGTENLLTGNVSGATSQFGDAADDAAGAVKDIGNTAGDVAGEAADAAKDLGKTITDPFTGW